MLVTHELRQVVRRDGTLATVKVPTSEFTEALGDPLFRSGVEVPLFRYCRTIELKEPLFDARGRVSSERITAKALGFTVSEQRRREREMESQSRGRRSGLETHIFLKAEYRKQNECII